MQPIFSNPSSLSSSESWENPHLVNEMGALSPVPVSPRVEFTFDEPPYVVTTEVGQKEALRKLSRISSAPNGILLGFANEFNYNILANRDLNRAIICDINARMHRVYEWISTNILKFELPDDFLHAFKAEMEANYYLYQNYLGTPDDVIRHYQQDFMWTSNVFSYQKVRSYYQQGLITHLNVDLIKDGDYFDTLANWARQSGYVFDCVYVSNIPEWAEYFVSTDTRYLNID